MLCYNSLSHSIFLWKIFTVQGKEIKMSIKFSVKMNEKYMYDFFLCNIYSKISGISMLILGGIALAMSIRTWITSSFTMAMPTMIVAVLFIKFSKR